MPRTIHDSIAEQNRLAQNIAPGRPFTVVRVLVASRYSGPDLKAVRARPGDIIAVAGNGYAADLAKTGLVELVVVEEPTANDDHGQPDDDLPDDLPPVVDDLPEVIEELPVEPLPEIEPAVEEPDADEDEDEDDALAALTIGQLRTMAKEAGINSAGMNKAQLVEALIRQQV